jgi:hypothetical protein
VVAPATLTTPGAPLAARCGGKDTLRSLSAPHPCGVPRVVPSRAHCGMVRYGRVGLGLVRSGEVG